VKFYNFVFHFICPFLDCSPAFVPPYVDAAENETIFPSLSSIESIQRNHQNKDASPVELLAVQGGGK
jgi:hypothetical protein